MSIDLTHSLNNPYQTRKKTASKGYYPPIHSPLFNLFPIQVNHAEIFAYRSDATTSIITEYKTAVTRKYEITTVFYSLGVL